MNILKEKRPGTITEGLVRVDIMERNDGALIVNEFEGFEAQFTKDETSDTVVRHFLKLFWARKLSQLYTFVRS